MDAATYIDTIKAAYASEGHTLTLSPASDSTLALLSNLPYEPTWLVSIWKLANGGPAYFPIFARPGYLTGYDLLSIEDAMTVRESLARRAPQYDDYTDPHPRDHRVMPGWYHDSWIPFASFGGGTLLLILQEEHVIAYTHDPDEMSYVSPVDEFLDLSAKWFLQEKEEMFEGLEE